MRILVTGGAGYIGSHAAVVLIESGYDVVIVDNLINSHEEVINRIVRITGKEVTFVKADILDQVALDRLFSSYEIDAVMHFAGLKAVGESVAHPLEYYTNNFYGSLVLCEAMKKASVKKIIFSSSATVYGENAPVPYIESMPRGQASNPYGSSKAMTEQALEDLALSDPEWSVVLLRYFNPIGAHSSGLIGEDPLGVPNNLMPYISQVAAGKREVLSIYGNDYLTKDGTCIRDYIHIMDLAAGHMKALKCLEYSGVNIYNLGTGQGYSVLEVLNAFEEINKVKVPHVFAPRRDGDLPAFWSDASKAEAELDWSAQLDITDMVGDVWKWQSKNPEGYQ